MLRTVQRLFAAVTSFGRLESASSQPAMQAAMVVPVAETLEEVATPLVRQKPTVVPEVRLDDLHRVGAESL